MRRPQGHHNCKRKWWHDAKLNHIFFTTSNISDSLRGLIQSCDWLDRKNFRPAPSESFFLRFAFGYLWLVNSGSFYKMSWVFSHHGCLPDLYPGSITVFPLQNKLEIWFYFRLTSALFPSSWCVAQPGFFVIMGLVAPRKRLIYEIRNEANSDS